MYGADPLVPESGVSEALRERGGEVAGHLSEVRSPGALDQSGAYSVFAE
jgi:hypothetical protein